MELSTGFLQTLSSTLIVLISESTKAIVHIKSIRQIRIDNTRTNPTHDRIRRFFCDLLDLFLIFLIRFIGDGRFCFISTHCTLIRDNGMICLHDSFFCRRESIVNDILDKHTHLIGNSLSCMTLTSLEFFAFLNTKLSQRFGLFSKRIVHRICQITQPIHRKTIFVCDMIDIFRIFQALLERKILDVIRTKEIHLLKDHRIILIGGTIQSFKEFCFGHPFQIIHGV